MVGHFDGAKSDWSVLNGCKPLESAFKCSYIRPYNKELSVRRYQGPRHGVKFHRQLTASYAEGGPGPSIIAGNRAEN